MIQHRGITPTLVYSCRQGLPSEWFELQTGSLFLIQQDSNDDVEALRFCIASDSPNVLHFILTWPALVWIFLFRNSKKRLSSFPSSYRISRRFILTQRIQYCCLTTVAALRSVPKVKNLRFILKTNTYSLITCRSRLCERLLLSKTNIMTSRMQPLLYSH